MERLALIGMGSYTCMQWQEKLVLSYFVAGWQLDHEGSDLVKKLTYLQIFNVIALKAVTLG